MWKFHMMILSKSFMSYLGSSLIEYYFYIYDFTKLLKPNKNVNLRPNSTILQSKLWIVWEFINKNSGSSKTWGTNELFPPMTLFWCFYCTVRSFAMWHQIFWENQSIRSCMFQCVDFPRKPHHKKLILPMQQQHHVRVSGRSNPLKLFDFWDSNTCNESWMGWVRGSRLPWYSRLSSLSDQSLT